MEDKSPKQRMIINNNFNGARLGTSQVFVETGTPPKQPPAHNIQLVNGKSPDQAPAKQASPFQPFQGNQQQQHHGMNYG